MPSAPFCSLATDPEVSDAQRAGGWLLSADVSVGTRSADKADKDDTHRIAVAIRLLEMAQARGKRGTSKGLRKVGGWVRPRPNSAWERCCTGEMGTGSGAGVRPSRRTHLRTHASVL